MACLDAGRGCLVACAARPDEAESVPALRARPQPCPDVALLERHLLGFLLADTGGDALLQHVQRQRAAVQYLVVEVADAELVTEFLLGHRAQLEDLELTEL